MTQSPTGFIPSPGIGAPSSVGLRVLRKDTEAALVPISLSAVIFSISGQLTSESAGSKKGFPGCPRLSPALGTQELIQAKYAPAVSAPLTAPQR